MARLRERDRTAAQLTRKACACFEHYGNYVATVLPFRYDAFLYLDKTEALHPLHLEPEGTRVPETYPWGL